MKANAQLAAGPFEITFGGVKNPRSFKPTDLFEINSFDKAGNVVATGTTDNIAMTTAGPFKTLYVKPSN